MKRSYLIIAVICIVIIVAGVFLYFIGGEEEMDIGKDIQADGLEISSPSFSNGETIPSKYTSDGQDISPPLNISGADGETLVIIMDDPDAPGGTFTHWLIWNIPAETQEISEGIPQQERVSELGNAAQGANDFGEIGYGGPKPPKGERHEYRITVYTLDKKLNLSPGATKKELKESMEDQILQKNRISGFYER